MQAFLDVINEIKDDKSATSLSYEFLYKNCINEEYPWGNVQNLIDKIRAVGATAKANINDGFIKIDKNGEKHVYKFTGDKGKLYIAVAERLNREEKINFEALIFDCAENDLKALEQSIVAVSNLNEVVKDAVRKFNKENGIYDKNGENLPPYMKFASTFLHCHFSHRFIPFSYKIYGKSKRLFHVGKCDLKGYIVPDQIKQELFARYKKIFDYLYGELKAETSVLNIYIHYCAYAYAFGCFLKENIAGDINPISLAVKVFDCIGSDK